MRIRIGEERKMTISLAPRLPALKGRKIAILDCGKRGGAPILQGIATALAARGELNAVTLEKSSPHSCASRKLIDQITSTCDAVVYGVVN